MNQLRTIPTYVFSAFLGVLLGLFGCTILKHPDRLAEQRVFTIIPSSWIGARVHNLWKLDSTNLSYDPLEISGMILLSEYKKYLEAIRIDSAEYYVTDQLPNPEFTSQKLIDEYTANPIYENEPVIGVSWESALHYCAWRTRIEQGDTLRYVYRLPTSWEWEMADAYAQKELKSHDFDATLSNWLLDSRYPYTSNKEFEGKRYIYWHLGEDPPALKRKMIAGNSYQYSFRDQRELRELNFYADKGYKQVGFRIIKDYDLTSGRFADDLIKYWEVMP